MKKNFGLILAIALGLSALLLTITLQSGWVQANPSRQAERSGAPAMVSYQGQIWDGDIPYNGTGYFKFAILDFSSTIQYWSNDTLTESPAAYVTLPVVNGLFSVTLGDTSIEGMNQPLTASVFDETYTCLRVWFSPDASNWTQIPDHKIVAVPYALQAQYASDSDTLDNKHGSEYQLRINTICPDNYTFNEIDASGDGVCIPVEHRPPYSLTVVNDSGDDSFEPSIAIGVDGLPLISFFRGSDSTHGGLHVMHCRTLDCTAYDVYRIDTSSSAYTGIESSLVIGKDGLGLITYVDMHNDRLYVAHCVDIACSSVDNKHAIWKTTRDYLQGVSSVIGVDGYPLISFIEYGFSSGDVLDVIHCSNIYCNDYESTPVYVTDDVIERETSLTIGVDGFGLLSFHNHSTGDLWIAHCTNIACSTFTTMAIDSSADVGVDNSITRGNDGLGLIAYYSESDGALKVAHCDNMTCSSATSVVIDNEADIAGNWPDITIGSDGLGFIVYDAFDGKDQILKMAHCSDITCSSAVTYVIDNLGDTSYAGIGSVTIGTDGLPLIAYYDTGTTGLKIMHCSNNFCLPYTRSH